MTYQHKPDSGSLFRNDKKDSDKHPDYKGSALIDGKEYWLSAWVNDGKNGKYMSVKFAEKQDAHDNGMKQAQAALNDKQDDFEDSEIPF